MRNDPAIGVGCTRDQTESAGRCQEVKLYHSLMVWFYQYLQRKSFPFTFVKIVSFDRFDLSWHIVSNSQGLAVRRPVNQSPSSLLKTRFSLKYIAHVIHDTDVHHRDDVQFNHTMIKTRVRRRCRPEASIERVRLLRQWSNEAGGWPGRQCLLFNALWVFLLLHSLSLLSCTLWYFVVEYVWLGTSVCVAVRVTLQTSRLLHCPHIPLLELSVIATGWSAHRYFSLWSCCLRQATMLLNAARHITNRRSELRML